MTRNLKALGLALVAAMALGAIGAQGAAAEVSTHSFRSESNDTVLTGQSESYSSSQTSQHVFTATPELTVECDATFEGTNTETKSDTVRVRPTYTNCKNSVTVDNTGCEYIFDSDTEQASGHSTSSAHARVSLFCGANHEHWIEITRPGCNIRFETTHDDSPGVTVNQSLSGVTYTNLANHGPSGGKSALTVNATIRTISYTVRSGSFCGLAGHAAGTYTNGSYDGLASVTGYAGGNITNSGTLTTGRTWSHSAQSSISYSTPE